jgi:hypothetical protein
MKIYLLLIVLLAGIWAGCKKNGNADDYTRTFYFDVKNLDLIIGMKKVHNLTDSFYFELATKDMYNCDKYRINTSQEDDGKTFKITCGNIIQEGGQCIYGAYPAIYLYKSPKLAEGRYRIIVKKNTAEFEGELIVTANNYAFDWVHDEHGAKIDPKNFPR